MYVKLLKPSFDFIFAFIALLVLSPLILILSLLVYFKLGKPVFFIQQRPGKGEKIITLYKFRTMTDKHDHSGKSLEDKDRLTKVGTILRRTSLDELPQLVNVLKGDVSFIGPRPLLVEYLPLYTEDQKRRHLVKPGITGWAQVNGRNNISWKEKFKLDLWYIDNLSFILDIKILIMTIMKIILREGISKDGFATSDAFNGNN